MAFNDFLKKANLYTYEAEKAVKVYHKGRIGKNTH